MSDGPQQREWRFYVEALGIDRAAFSTDPMRCAAVLRNIELMGKAAIRLPADVRATARGVPRRMKA